MVIHVQEIEQTKKVLMLAVVTTSLGNVVLNTAECLEWLDEAMLLLLVTIPVSPSCGVQ